MEPLSPPVEETPTAAATVVTPEAPSVGLHEMTRPERDQFLRDGKAPTREPKPDSDGGTAVDGDSSAPPADGKKAAEIAAKDTKAASEPAESAKDKKARNSEGNRVKELLAERERERSEFARERHEMRQRLESLERSLKSDGKPDSSTTKQPSEPKHKQYAADKAFPKINDFESPDEWAAAVAVFTEQKIESVLSQRDNQSAESQVVRQVAERAFSRGAAEVEADPAILDRIHPELEALPGARAVRAAGHEPNINHLIKDQVLLESERPLGLMAFYSTPEGQREWDAMRRMDERGITRTIVAREHALGTVSRSEPAPEKKPAAKTFTKTPNPPEKEGPKGAKATDGAESAVQTGDFAEFERTMDARGDGLSRRFGRRRAS